MCHIDNRIKHVCQNASKPSQCIMNKKTADLASASTQHKERVYIVIYHTFLKIEKNKQKCYSKLRSMIKAFNLTMLDVATRTPFIASMQLTMIENMHPSRSFPCRHNNLKAIMDMIILERNRTQ